MRLYWVVSVTLYTYDVTWEGFQLWIWTAVEVNLGVVCGCAPMLRPLVAKGRGWYNESVKQKRRKSIVRDSKRRCVSVGGKGDIEG